MKFYRVCCAFFISFSTMIFFSTASYGHYTDLLTMSATTEETEEAYQPCSSARITVRKTIKPRSYKAHNAYDLFLAKTAPSSELLLQLLSVHHPLPTKESIHRQRANIAWLMNNLKESLAFYRLYAIPYLFSTSVSLPTRDDISILLNTVSIRKTIKLQKEILTLLEWVAEPNTTDEHIQEKLPEKRAKVLEFTVDRKISEEKNGIAAQNHLEILTAFIKSEPLYRFITTSRHESTAENLYSLIKMALYSFSGRYLLLTLKMACNRDLIREFCIGWDTPNVSTIWVQLQGQRNTLKELHESIGFLLDHRGEPETIKYRQNITKVASSINAFYIE